MGMNIETNKLNGMSKDLSSDVKDVAHRAGSQLEKFSQDAGSKVGEYAANIQNRSSDYIKRGREYVETNPARSVAYAAAAGLVVGGLISMAMRRRD